MRIAIACDHAGFPLKAAVTEVVNSAGHQVFDFGTDSTEPVDYPDVVERACRALQKVRWIGLSSCAVQELAQPSQRIN